MATVYEAYDPSLDRSVAMKILKSEFADDPELEARFLYEARILGQMDHPGVLPVFAAGALPHHGSYYAMKKVRGRTLGDILTSLRRPGRADRREGARLIEVFEKVCQTVAYAHSQGIVHRDLKPDNVMVDDFGVVLVMDWGLSKKVDQAATEQEIQATQAGVVKGTPAYMSPEQARGRPEDIDYRTDVFALGIILYEILAGRAAFRGQTVGDVVEEIKHREPPHPRQVNRRASRVLSAICMKALSKDPNDRYPSAEELAEDIRLYRGYLPTSAYRPRLLDRLGNWIWRHTALAAAIGTALVLLLVLGGVAWNRYEARRIRRAEERERERLVKALDEQREKEKLHKSMLAIRKGAASVRAFDERILALKDRRRKLEPGDAARLRALGHQIDQLETARHVLTNSLRSLAVSLITELKGQKGGEISQLDPEVLKFFRELAVEAVQNLVKRGDYYKAHYDIWRYLGSRRESPIQWTQAQLKELTELNEQVEEKLRQRLGPDAALPNWGKYSDKMLRRRGD